ncbi:hypothetical protein [Streptomyces sp. NPDC050560]|uniref:hypothetical protein n=1 Tax=Streptomyces sp. NPDC050560 TaxID=3365630 RepID=UPI00378C6591
MRSTITAVLERNTTVRADFATEPYELPWAAEARFFVQALDMAGEDTALDFTTEISPDGLHWCPLDIPPARVTAPGLTSWGATGFGQWLRLGCRVTGTAPVAKLRIYLVGKS